MKSRVKHGFVFVGFSSSARPSNAGILQSYPQDPPYFSVYLFREISTALGLYGRAPKFASSASELCVYLFSSYLHLKGPEPVHIHQAQTEFNLSCCLS